MSACTVCGTWRDAWVLLALSASVLAPAATMPNVAVTAIRVQDSAAASTQVVVELAARRDAKLFTLKAPDRIVLDIPNVEVAPLIVSEAAALPAHGEALRRIRVGRQPGNVLRVVLDLSRTVSPALSMIAGNEGRGSRLVIDLSDGVSTPASMPGVRIVAIDAAHGGADSGSLGRGGTREKDITLSLAKVVAERVNALPGWRAVLVRSDDSNPGLAERSQRAADVGASAFLSLQANAAANPDLAGAALYVFDQEASSRNAAWLAEREDANDGTPGQTTEMGTPTSVATAGSRVLADAMLRELLQGVVLQRAAVQHAPMVSLRQVAAPALVIDVGSLSNREDEQRLRGAEYLSHVADAIARALGHYPDRPVPAGTSSPVATVVALIP